MAVGHPQWRGLRDSLLEGFKLRNVVRAEISKCTVTECVGEPWVWIRAPKGTVLYCEAKQDKGRSSR